ncbi:hypothetical protein CHU98_g10588 [Xylaria longipes]|nr:hypothetical protein CHU98_g10588 [Xylaria longipes]
MGFAKHKGRSSSITSIHSQHDPELGNIAVPPNNGEHVLRPTASNNGEVALPLLPTSRQDPAQRKREPVPLSHMPIWYHAPMRGWGPSLTKNGVVDPWHYRLSNGLISKPSLVYARYEYAGLELPMLRKIDSQVAMRSKRSKIEARGTKRSRRPTMLTPMTTSVASNRYITGLGVHVSKIDTLQCDDATHRPRAGDDKQEAL